MKEINISTVVYETEDGRQFYDSNEALEHERHIKYTDYFLIYANPDLTEGRHDGKIIGYLPVDRYELSSGSDIMSKERALEFARMWCQEMINRKEYIMPYGFSIWGPMHNWRVYETSLEYIKENSIDQCGSISKKDGFLKKRIKMIKRL